MQMLKGDYEKTRMVLKWKMHGIDWFFENRPLERLPNYSKLLLSVETDYQTTLIFCLAFLAILIKIDANIKTNTKIKYKFKK